jgi:TolB protein
LWTAALLTGPAAAQAAFPGSNGDIVFTGVHQSPFGFFVPFPATAGGSGIYVTNPDGTDVRPLKVAPRSSAAPENEGFAGPKWSPDGSKIAYSHWSGGAVRIEVMNADGSGSEPIGPAGTWGPAWSPDGSMIAFTRPEQSVGIYVMDADGGNPRLLVAERAPWAESATWSPDCSRIAFSADGGLWTMRADGRVHVVSRGFDPDGGFDPDWSPDGRKIAYWRWAGGEDEWFGAKLFVVNADGSRERRVRAGASPAWSPDGSRIVFARWGGLATISADGSDLRTVTVADNTVQWHIEPDWQPLTEAAPSAGLCDAWRTDLNALSPLRVSVRPRTARPEEPTTFRFKVTREGDRRVRRAVIYFAGQQTRTNARGKGAITHEFPHNVRRRAVATKAGFRHDTVTVRTPPES